MLQYLWCCAESARADTADRIEDLNVYPPLHQKSSRHDERHDLMEGRPTEKTEEASEVSYGFDLESNAGLSKWGVSPTRSRAQTRDQADVIEEHETARPTGILGPTLRGFKAAVLEWSVCSVGAANFCDPLTEVQRVPFMEGLNAYSQALDLIGGGMGSYLKQNVEKLDRSKATSSSPDYRLWVLSELPVHAATNYKSYVDDSAFMANLWIGWNLEFFVEFLAEVYDGSEPKKGADTAYKRTLMKHHNMFQRAAFTAAVLKLPSREKLVLTLQGSDPPVGLDVLVDISDFIYMGRCLSEFCIRLNRELSERLAEEKEAKGKR